MIPTPIPDKEVWAGTTRRVIGPPKGMEPWEIPPVEVLQEITDQGPLIHVRIALEPDDVRRIREGTADHFWLTLWSDHLHAFNVQLPIEQEPVDPDPPEVCPSCGFTGRQANVWQGGILVRSCRDPWHHQETSDDPEA